MTRQRLILGDCVEVMRAMPAESVAAIVCDPPYGYRFMGKEFDSLGDGPAQQAWHAAWCAEALRVLLPGGYLLAFGGTRTYHRLASAIEDAGFELRDSLVWQYGSGFPKSVNASIAIDKAHGAMGHRGKAIIVAGDGGQQANLVNPGGAPAHDPITDDAKRWQGWGSALKPAFEPVVVARKPLAKGLTLARNVLEHGTGALNIDGCRVGYAPGEVDFDKVQRQQHSEGAITGAFGAASLIGKEIATYKPGGRWPANVIFTHAPGCVRVGSQKVKATSGIRPDDVGTDYGKQHKSGSMAGAKGVTLGATYADADGTETVAAYECAPGCPVAALDAQSGAVGGGAKARVVTKDEGRTDESAWRTKPIKGTTRVVGDTGGASRFFTVTEYGDDDHLPGELPGDPPFFYGPKAARSEREAGCEGLPPRTGSEAVDRAEGSAGAQSPRAGAGRTADVVRNHHPTVKPVAVMRWLVKLSVPKGGIVLDPFMGSGTTGVAAVREGFHFVGIERDPEYLAIATARISAAANKKH